AKAENRQDPHLDGRIAAGAIAHAGRRLPERDALPPPRRPRPEAGRRAARLSSGPDDGVGWGEALAGETTERVANLLSPHRPGELDGRRRARGRTPACARDRQSSVAASHGPRPRRHAERLRHARRQADPPRAARLAGVGTDPQWMAPKA